MNISVWIQKGGILLTKKRIFFQALLKMFYTLCKMFQSVLILCIFFKEVISNEDVSGNWRDVFKNGRCAVHEFRCLNDQCIKRSLFCNGRKDCTDGSDENYCQVDFNSYRSSCPSEYGFFKCADRFVDKCIPTKWKCDGLIDCNSGWDESGCTDSIENFGIPRTKAINWLLNISKKEGTERWSDQVHRIAIALYLSDAILTSSVMSELAYEVNLQLLSKIAKENIQSIPSSDIALYIHSLLATCGDPRNFYSFDLVSELRKLVDAQKYTNPYAILALCNAGDQINEKDFEKLTDAFYSNHTEFWTDTQAYAIMAMGCAMFPFHPNYKNYSDIVEEFTAELRKNQQVNGIVDNVKTTSLVMQALFIATFEENQDLFNERTAMSRILAHQMKDGSFGNFMNTYYTLPVLNYKSFAHINPFHCPMQGNEREIMLYKKWSDEVGSVYDVLYSQWIGDKKEIQRSLKLPISAPATLYSLMEMAASVDDKYRFKTNFKDEKQFIYSLADIQDDPESGKYWFLYFLNGTDLIPIRNSPDDFIVEKNQHFVHWFRTGAWHSE